MIAGRHEQLGTNRYKTKKWSAYNEALSQRGSLTIWCDPDMEWIPPPTGKRGCQQSFRACRWAPQTTDSDSPEPRIVQSPIGVTISEVFPFLR